MDVLKTREMLQQIYTRNALIDIREQSLKHTRLFTKAKVKSVRQQVVEIEMSEELYRIKYENILSVHVHDNLITYDNDYQIVSLSFTVADLKNLLKENNRPANDEFVSILLNDRRFDLLKSELASFFERQIKEIVLKVD
ncbi:hypothetical protein LSG31_11745 [Fodinisporobacter ferrooxydans]|uniref:IDEAL domain-containing protein n=1 Tax=Fodinisporobacter ferrooxydans TaxID=2901836 RepID=A0ABY4CDY2_9BACL|nr:hypothetical protein LSG31_11745 [Alicyclobacillaceae bacterium MYW30-H2]